jgi:menaquinone-dependent protoporphyrinogen oxidase
MRVLVTAATKYGSTAEIARAIGDVLAERGFDTTVIPPQEVGSIEDYDAVVLGSAAYAGHWLEPAKELVDRSGDALAGRPVWLFSSGPVGDPSRKMVQKMGEDPVDVAEILAATQAPGPSGVRGEDRQEEPELPGAGHAHSVPRPRRGLP